jgi:hypothetical protein
LVKQLKLNQRPTVRLLREGDLAAEVAVTLLETGAGWTSYISLEDTYKLDDVRNALRTGDISRAAKLAERVYRLRPVEPSAAER